MANSLGTGRTHKVASSTRGPKAVHVHRHPVHVAFGEDPVCGDSGTHELSQAQASTSPSSTPAGHLSQHRARCTSILLRTLY